MIAIALAFLLAFFTPAPIEVPIEVVGASQSNLLAVVEEVIKFYQDEFGILLVDWDPEMGPDRVTVEFIHDLGPETQEGYISGRYQRLLVAKDNSIVGVEHRVALWQSSCKKVVTLAHELAHALGAKHSSGGLMSTHCEKSTLAIDPENREIVKEGRLQ